MNMKKTMAAIAAGAVAVSAMATTVSAVTIESRTLTYNLVKNEKKDDAKGTYTATFSNLALEAGGKVEIYVKNASYFNDIVTISGSFWDGEAGTNKTFTPVVATGANWETGYSIEGDRLWVKQSTGVHMTGDDAWENNIVAVPVVAGSSAGTNTALKASTQANLTITVKKSGLPSNVDYVGALNKEILEGRQGVSIKVTGVSTPAVEVGDVITPAVNAAVATTGTTATGASISAANQATANGAITTDMTLTYKSDIAGDGSVPAGWFSDVATKTSANLTTLGVTCADTTDGAVIKLTKYTAAVTATEAAPATYGYIYESPVSGSATEVTGCGIDKTPFKSTLMSTTDVLNNIWTPDDNSTLVPKAHVVSVINDCVAKYSDVTFVFNTATQKVKGDKYSTDGDAVDYTSFQNHYYNSLQAGYDPQTTYILNNWLGDNLFSGAILINSNLTLSLTDTQKFDWTATSLSFTWEAVQDTALTKNQYANYIQNMFLRTSDTWYWDNFQVVLGETEVEEVESGAPVEGDVADLDEEEEETDFGDVEPEEEEEEEEETEPVAEVAPVVENNPSTGNAPVALAVIPVALAAAAIVAKKRG